METGQEARDLSEQIGPAASYAPELGDRGSGLGLGRLAPASMSQGDPVQPGHGQPVTFGDVMILNHPAIIEYLHDKCKLAMGNLSSCDNEK